jgi:hypothetical protein
VLFENDLIHLVEVEIFIEGSNLEHLQIKENCFSVFYQFKIFCVAALGVHLIFKGFQRETIVW